MGVRIVADRDKCIGAGQCVISEPDLFHQDEDGLVVILVERPDDPEVVRKAVRRCPTQALELAE